MHRPPLRIGAIFPQTEFGPGGSLPDPAAIRDYAQAVEALGFSHVLAYDHILGANPERPGGFQGPYTFKSSFLEPLVLFGYMAAVTRRLEFTTGVIILPQRQTAVFAKQAATLDVLSSGRLRLGVGLGWNAVEYVALNEDFHNRGRRIEEQVLLLRKLWTQPLVEFSGRWHQIPDAGINPLPVQRPIPIWFGGHAEAVLQRAARLGDGWMPTYRRPADALPHLEKLDQFLSQAGRSRDDFGVEARLPFGDGNPENWEKLMRGWQAAGVGWFTVNTMHSGLGTPAAHLSALEKFAAAVGLSE